MVLFSQCTPLHEGKMCTRNAQPIACTQAIQDVQHRLTCFDENRIILTDVWGTGKKPDVLTLFVQDGSSAYGVQLKIKSAGNGNAAIELIAADGTKGIATIRQCSMEQILAQEPEGGPVIPEEIDDMAIPAGVDDSK